MDSFSAFSESPEPSFKHSTYFSVYDSLLGKYKNRPITFMEIGVLNGGSLFMWRKFLGPQARIVGVDINPAALKWVEHGFEIYIGDQSSPYFWSEIKQKIEGFDVILDDGGHTYVQQIVTVESLLDSVRDGGILIVEDTHTSYMEGFGEKNTSFLNYVFKWVHKLNSRFGSFRPIQSDKRVFSIQIFESFVAFNVDREKSSAESKPLWNHGKPPEKRVEDFRETEQIRSAEESNAIAKILSRAFSVFG